MYKLIITADDWGMSPKFNQGILDCVNAGKVTSVSVLVNRAHVNAKQLSTLPVAIGLHLQITPGEHPHVQIKQQLTRFKQLFGRLPDYLDGHEHAHLLNPIAFREVVKLAKRIHRPVRSIDDSHRKAFRKAGVKTPNRFIITWKRSRKQLAKQIMKLPHGVSEMMVHPGYYDQENDNEYNKLREREIALLRSSTVNEALQRKGVKLVSHNTLR